MFITHATHMRNVGNERYIFEDPLHKSCPWVFLAVVFSSQIIIYVQNVEASDERRG